MVERPNRAVLNDALDEYRDAMRPFIVRAMRRIKGKHIEDAIYDTLSPKQADEFELRLQNNGNNIEGAIDIGDFPNIISRNWGQVFSQQFRGDMNVRNLLYIITEARNKVSHPLTEDLDTEYVRVVLYHIADVLGKINAPESKTSVEGFRDTLSIKPKASKLLIPDEGKLPEPDVSVIKSEGNAMTQNYAHAGKPLNTPIIRDILNVLEPRQEYVPVSTFLEILTEYHLQRGGEPTHLKDFHTHTYDILCAMEAEGRAERYRDAGKNYWKLLTDNSGVDKTDAVPVSDTVSEVATESDCSQSRFGRLLRSLSSSFSRTDNSGVDKTDAVPVSDTVSEVATESDCSQSRFGRLLRSLSSPFSRTDNSGVNKTDAVPVSDTVSEVATESDCSQSRFGRLLRSLSSPFSRTDNSGVDKTDAVPVSDTVSEVATESDCSQSRFGRLLRSLSSAVSIVT